VQAHANRPALLHPEGELSYQTLWDHARQLSCSKAFISEPVQIIAGQQSLEEYIQIFACFISGKPYLPLNPKMPAARVASILSSLEHWIARSQIPDDLEQGRLSELAYVIFTSGSTGEPKGVPITQVQLSRYCATLTAILNPVPSDRVLQLGDLSFDISIMAMAMAWPHGAALCTVPSHHVLMAPRYAQELKATIWLSVPSVVQLSAKAGLLPPDSLPHIRLGIFGGEALSDETAMILSDAAPHARICNFYGPTEGTISLSHFEIDRPNLQSWMETSPPLGIMPLGKPHPGVQLALWDEEKQCFSTDSGEICAHSEQITSGYIRGNAAESELLNASAFSMHAGQRWYHTGDFGKYDARYGYRFLGRVDRQIKYKGYRIELQECDRALAQASGSDQACVMPQFATDLVSSNPQIIGLIGFFVAPPQDEDLAAEERLDTIMRKLEKILPAYMIPSKLIALEALPVNAHGKIDYQALLEQMTEKP
jgi:non-ribosomal peptide synthetase component F